MKFSLRSYQQRALDRIRELGRTGKRRVALVSPTASGKTIMAGAIMEGAMRKGSRVLFLAHRKELIDQPSRLLDQMSIDHGVIKANHWRRRPDAPVQVASMQTLLRRELPPADLVVIDEAHRVAGAGYTQILQQYPKAFVLLLTATPWRLDGRGLADYADEIVEVAQVQELIDEGYLCPLRIYAPDQPDLSGIKSRCGDYDQRALGQKMQETQLVGRIVDEWKRLGEGRRTLLFASSIEHSLDVVQRFKDAGISADHLDGTMDDSRREHVLARLDRGETTVLSNVDCVVEGFDLPSIGCVVGARPSKSLTRVLQAIGRCMRIEEGKPYAIVLDHAGWIREHGLPTQHREWTLEGRKKGEKRAEAIVPLVTCETCGTIRPHTQPFCATCRGVQTCVFKGIPIEVDGKLVEVTSIYRCGKCESDNVKLESRELQVIVDCRDCKHRSYEPDKIAAKQASEARRRAEYDRLEAVRTRKGFKEGWTSIQYRNLFGTWPPKAWRPQHQPTTNNDDEEIPWT